MSKKLWFDMTNSSHVNFFRPFIEEFREGNELILTTRDLAETNELLDNLGLDYRTFGGYMGRRKLMKILGHIGRSFRLLPHVRKCDFFFSHGSVSPIFVRHFSSGKLISSYDNEHADSFRLLGKHSDYFIVPEVLEKDALEVAGRNTKVFTYPGVKEQIYLADFEPDKNEVKEIPFDDYLVLRPEAWKSHYIGKDQILAFKLAKRLIKEGYNIVLLPRYGNIPDWIRKERQVYIPEHALDGPQLCWFSQGVLTGSGTLAREAAVLGVPAVSFYPGEGLKVSEWLVGKRCMLKTYDVFEIINILKNGHQNKYSFENELVKKRFFKLIKKIIDAR